MTTRTEKDKAKQLQDKCQSVLNALLRDDDNKYCVDCDAKGPRWASWNLGVFLCIRCAGIHRNLGVHISKVKSVNLDTWTPEQVVSLQQMGNSRARAVYEANLPDNFRRPQNDSSLESFIRAKYEHKKYIAREWVPPTLPKVNWEKEIDEEIERQKNKKKTIKELKTRTVSNIEVPQLPKPKNPSPKPGRAAQPVIPPVSSSSSTSAVENKQSADLLSLQNGEDGFSGFLSAPPATTPSAMKEEKKKEEADPVKSEEESFFNQTAPTEKEKVKLTKDSILALYGTAPPVNNFNQFQSQPQVMANPKFTLTFTDDDLCMECKSIDTNLGCIQCDKCNFRLCAPCSNLSALEFDCVLLGDRKLHFFCDTCKVIDVDDKDLLSLKFENLFLKELLTQVNVAISRIQSIERRKQKKGFDNEANNNNEVPYQQGFASQQNFQNFSGFPQQAFPVQNGISQFPQGQMQQFPGQFQNQQFATPVQWGAMPAQQNPIQFGGVPQQGQFNFQNGPSSMGMQSNAAFPATNQFQQMGGQFQASNFTPQATVPNPFFGTTQTNSLQHQFGNLTLSNPSTASTTSSLTANIWQ